MDVKAFDFTWLDTNSSYYVIIKRECHCIKDFFTPCITLPNEHDAHRSIILDRLTQDKKDTFIYGTTTEILEDEFRKQLKEGITALLADDSSISGSLSITDTPICVHDGSTSLMQIGILKNVDKIFVPLLMSYT